MGRFARERSVPEAVDRMVVHQSRRLHERVADGGPDKAKTTLLQVLAHRVGLGCRRRDLAVTTAVTLQRSSPDEAPDVSIERAFRLGNAQEGGGIRNGALDL